MMTRGRVTEGAQKFMPDSRGLAQAVAIVYETHSTTLDNERGFATGWLPGELSSTGRENAAELGRRRRNDGIDVVFTSDLARAVETARIAFGDSAVPIIQDARLRECNYGDLNGAPVSTLSASRASHIEVPFPGGESYLQVVDRTRDFLRDLARDWDGKRVLLIGHSANRWALQTLVDGTPLREAVVAPFDWQEGWPYSLPSGWNGEDA